MTGRKRFVALSPDQIKKISRCSHIDLRAAFEILFCSTDSTNPRAAFEDLLEELGPNILPANHSDYQRLHFSSDGGETTSTEVKVEHFLQGRLSVEQTIDGKQGYSTDL